MLRDMLVPPTACTLSPVSAHGQIREMLETGRTLVKFQRSQLGVKVPHFGANSSLLKQRYIRVSPLVVANASVYLVADVPAWPQEFLFCETGTMYITTGTEESYMKSCLITSMIF